MSLIVLSITWSAVTKAIVLGINLFLYWQYRERFLGLWTLAWGLTLLKSGIDPFIFDGSESLPALILFQGTGMLCTLLLAWGTADFTGRRLPKPWLYGAIILTMASHVGLVLRLPILLIAIPNVLAYSVIYIHAGLMLQREEMKSLAKYISSWALILTGLHQLDYPFFRPTDMAPWGYLFDSSLRLITATGLLLVYFERTRYHIARQEKQFRLLAENARDIIFRFILKPKSHLEYISPAVETITGYRPEEFYADPRLLRKLVHPEDRSLFRKGGKLALRETPLVFRMRTRERKQIWVELHFTLLGDRSGEPIAVEGILRDVTARKDMEQELFRLDRLNIVGQMAANIGHEIRNPLTTVRGYLQILSRKRDLEHYSDNFRLLLDELDRANALITEYLSLSKNRLTDRQPHNLNAIIESLFPLILADAISTNHIVRLELGEVPNLQLDEKEIRQLLLNFARNGLEAMDPGKTLTIRTAASVDTVTLSVQDQGREIPADILEKLGIPFFTTKETGTGLGLAICYSIANRHRAKIQVATGPDGTTFTVFFPRKN